MSCTATTITTRTTTPVGRGYLPSTPLPAEVLNRILLKLSTAPETPFNLPQKVLDRVLDFVPSSDLPSLLTVNSGFYRATKPQLFRELQLTKDFKVRGHCHELADTWNEDHSRPIFKLEWLYRVTTVLSIDAHDPTACSSLPLPHLPFLHTVRLPYDVHCSISENTEPTTCAIHALKPLHVVHTDLSWHKTLGTTSNFADGTIKSYTAFLAYDGLRRERSWPDPMASTYTSNATITYIFPLMPRFTRRQRRALMAGTKADLDKNGQASVKPVLECQPLPNLPKGKPFSMETYHDLTGDCDHNARCIHTHFFNCAWSMNTAFWCNIIDSKAKFVFVGLDELLCSILGDREHNKRAHSHLAFLAKVQAGELLELLKVADEEHAVDHEQAAKYRAELNMYHSIDAPEPFRLLSHKDWLHSPGAEIAMLRKDLDVWMRVCEQLA